MKKKPLFVAFSTQKGGAGKSVFTVLVAGYLHYLKGYKVGIVDCDYPQHSIDGMRKREERIIREDAYYRQMAWRQFSGENSLKAYPVKTCSGEHAIQSALELLEASAVELDFIFFDLPGTLNSKGIISGLSLMDYIFSPVSADRYVLESTLEFTSLLNENILSVGKGNLKGLYLFWTKVDRRERNNLYSVYTDVIAELGLQLLATSVPDKKCFRYELENTHKPVFRSSFFPADRKLIKESRLDELTEEILTLISANEDEH